MALFYGPLTEEEFKIMLHILETGALKIYTQHPFDIIDVNDGQYRLSTERFSSKPMEVNGIVFNYLRRKDIFKAIDRNLLKTKILTEAGQVLFGNNK